MTPPAGFIAESWVFDRCSILSNNDQEVRKIAGIGLEHDPDHVSRQHANVVRHDYTRLLVQHVDIW